MNSMELEEIFSSVRRLKFWTPFSFFYKNIRKTTVLKIIDSFTCRDIRESECIILSCFR